MPLEHNTKEGGGAKYLIIAKERLVLASASYAPNESFYHQGQKNNISNFIFRGEAYALSILIYQGHMPHGSTRLCS